MDTVKGSIRAILDAVVPNSEREGLAKTPERFAKALEFFISGYALKPEDVVADATYVENHNEMIIVKDIDIFSICEHHLIPFFGKVHIGYYPKNDILGLSKFARIAEIFSRRLQVQERLTTEIANAINSVLANNGVAVVIEAQHMCMVMRGVEKPGSLTITSSMLGTFKTDPKAREEFLRMIKH